MHSELLLLLLHSPQSLSLRMCKLCIFLWLHFVCSYCIMRCARSRSLTVTISTAALVFIIIFIVLGQFTAHALQITKNNWNDGYKCITMNVCSFILSLDMYVMLFSTFRVYELIFLNILIWKQRFFWVLENKQLV